MPSPAPEPSAVADAATAILDAVVAAFAEVGVALPERRYRYIGRPAYDCEQVVVWLERIFPGKVGQQVTTAMVCGPLRVAQFNVDIVRCVALDEEGGIPAAGLLDGDGATLLTDAWLLHRGVERRIPDIARAPGYSVGLGATTPTQGGEARGGFLGMSLPVQVEMP